MNLCRKSHILIPALLVTVMSSLGCRTESTDGGEPWNVLLLTLDTTRWDRIGCYGYKNARTPRLDRIAGEGARFETALAQAPITLPSHCSIMTGTIPPSHGVRCNGFYSLGTEKETLAEILGEHGYQSAAVIGAFVLDSRFGLAQGFDVYDDDPDRMSKVIQFQDPSRSGDEVTHSALRIAAGFDKERPYFLWVHYFDPHFPYEAPAEFRKRFPETRDGLYDAEIAFMDHQIGLLLDGLARKGLMEKTIVVVVADHGEGFPGPHDEDSHGFYVYQDTLRIPLLFSAPGLIKPSVIPRMARQIDVFPTILDLLDFEPIASIEGKSLKPWLLGSDPIEEPEPSYAEAAAPWFAYGWATLYQLHSKEWKLIDGPSPELYRLTDDPEEKTNLAESHPDRVIEMRATLDSILDSASRAGNAGPSALPPDTRAQLEKLGYIVPSEAIAPKDRRQNTMLKNPKDWLHFHTSVKEVDTLYMEGKFQEAISRLEELEKLDPTNYQVQEHLGLFHEAAGDLGLAEESLAKLTRIRPELGFGYDRLADIQEKIAIEMAKEGRREEAAAKQGEAARNWKKAIDCGILEISPILKLATHYLKQSKNNEAEEILRIALSREPDDFDTNRFLGLTLLGSNRLDEAERFLEEALRQAGGVPGKELSVKGNLTDLYIARQDWDRAEETLEWIIRSFPDSPNRPSMEEVLKRIRDR